MFRNLEAPVTAGILAGLLAGVLITLLNLGITSSFYGTDREPYRAAVATAFDDAVLNREPRCSDFRHCFENECIVLASLLTGYSSPIEEMLVMKHADPDRCAGLYDYLNGRPAGIASYQRYLNGWRIFYFLSVPALGVQGSFLLTLVCGYVLLAAGCLFHARRLFRLRRGKDCGPLDDQAELGMLLIWTSFLIFFGWNYFGYQPTFALPAIVLFLMMLWLGHKRAYDRRPGVLYGGLALFGALTAQLDFLTGPAPLGLATLVGIMGLQLRQTETDLPRLVGAAAAFFVGFCAAFAAKIVVASLTLDPALVTNFSQQLSYRMSGDFFHMFSDELDARFSSWREYADVPGFASALFLAKMLFHSDRIGFGSVAMGTSVIIFAAVVLIMFIVFMLRNAGLRTANNLLLLASVGVIGVWFWIFFNHSIIHTHFMSRILVWPIAVSLILGARLYSAKLSRQSLNTSPLGDSG